MHKHIAFILAAALPLSIQAGTTGDAANIAARELAFSARAQVVDTRQAFREFFAHDAVSFDAGPTLAQPGLARLLEREPKREGSFEWWPHAVFVSGAGDLGLSTGPGHGKGPDGVERWFFYSSVWQRQTDGSYEVVLDQGVGIPTPAEPPAAWRRPATDPARAAALSAGERRVAESAMWDADTRLELAAESDPRAAILAVASPEMRLHRRRLAPMVGRDAIDAGLKGIDDAKLEWRIDGSRMAASGDFGVVWGTGRSTARAAGSAPVDIEYFRIWRKEAGQWRVLFDMAAPLRRAPPPTP